MCVWLYGEIHCTVCLRGNTDFDKHLRKLCGDTIVCNSGTIVCNGGTIVCHGGTIVCHGGTIVCHGGTIVCNGGTIVCNGGEDVYRDTCSRGTFE